MKKLVLLIIPIVFGCADNDYYEVHTISFNGEEPIVETSSGSYRNTANLSIHSRYRKGKNAARLAYNYQNQPHYSSYPQSKFVEYSNGNSTISRGRYEPNCEKVIHRGQRSYVVPCDY